MHRHLQAQEKRNRHPESSLWETEAGGAWLRLQVFAALYVFGLKAGVGADTLTLFFKMTRIDTHVGVSASALRTQINKMEVLLPKFQEACEKSVNKQKRKVVVGLDETFFGNFMILVLMDLRSGYLLLEDIADDRCYETWHKKVTPRLASLGIEVNHAISDRAKALIKMAMTGFKCESGADLFHAQQDMSRLLGAKTGKHAENAEKQLKIAQSAESKVSKTATELKVMDLKAARMTAEKALERAKKTQADYRENLQGIGDEVHPFSLNDNRINDAKKVEKQLELRAQAFEKIAEEQQINKRKGVMKKFRNQIKPLVVSVSFWWLLVHETLQSLVLDDETERWLTSTLLSVVYWYQKMEQTKNSNSKESYRKAWESASDKLKSDSFSTELSTSEMQQWLTLAENMARQFQRSSSAVEGRNGCLSQMYHNGRGLNEKRLKALTVIHNYGIKREDGTTAAMRLFDADFPDLFSWLLDEMGELPLPRNSCKRVFPNPLKLLDVPS